MNIQKAKDHGPSPLAGEGGPRSGSDEGSTRPQGLACPNAHHHRSVDPSSDGCAATFSRKGRRIVLAALLFLGFAPPALAADVVSPRPSGVAVTIYRDEAINDPAAAYWAGYGLAMITETRTVDLPAGESRLVFQGVAEGTLPQTAVLKDLPGRVVEQNFDFDLLGPGSLLERSVGQKVQVVRTNPKTGKETREDAVLRSGAQGAVLDFGNRVEALKCDGAPQRLVFDAIPPGLNGKATLSTRVRVDRPGRYRLTLAYLTVGLAWKAAYVARIAPDGATLDLSGWITLANHDRATFADAPTAVVAGRLAREAVQAAAHAVTRRAPGCWPMGNSHHPRGEQLYLAEAESGFIDEVVVTAQKSFSRVMDAPAPPPMAVAGMAEPRAKQSDLGDYKLYTLDEPTTVAAQQTKQVMFLHQPAVAFDTAYVFKLAPNGYPTDAHGAGPTQTTLRLQNKPAKGLGLALPAGAVSVRQPQGGSQRFIGEPQLRDVSVGEPFELEIRPGFGRRGGLAPRRRATLR